MALRDLLNGGSEGAYRCVYVNVESGQTARENVERGMRAILGSLGTRTRRTLGDESLARTRQRVIAPLLSGSDAAETIRPDDQEPGSGPPITVWGM